MQCRLSILYGIRLRLFLANQCSQLGLEQARHMAMANPRQRAKAAPGKFPTPTSATL
jgi:hypothetical protein